MIATKSRKSKQTTREHSNPDISIKDGDWEMKWFFLGENESIQTLTSTVYDHKFFGPAVVTTVTTAQGYRIHEYHVNDRSVYEHLARLINNGDCSGKVTSKLDQYHRKY